MRRAADRHVRRRRTHMLTFNVYDRVFFVQGTNFGTAFTIDVDNRQYLISAQHVVGSGEGLKLFHEHSWRDCRASFVGSGEGEIDITVLAPKTRLSPEIKLDPAIGGFILGQDVYFVGYPYKMWSEGGDVMFGRPLPFVKKGILSAGMNPRDEVKRLYVDAISNEGFSGGPVVAAMPNTINYHVIGVVSKFKIEYEPVIDSQDEDTGLRVAYNTGFLLAYSMKHALDIISNNPIGLLIDGSG